MTIDAHGNAHHPAGSLSGGQFASRANGAPTTPLTEPAPRTHDVILAEALRIGKIGARRPAGVDDPHLDDVRQVLWWSIHFRADPPATRTPREIHAELGGIEELTTPAIAETHAAMDHALRWVLGETDHPFRS